MKTESKIPAGPSLSASAFYRLVAQGVVVDGRVGGVLFGRKKDLGGIAVLRQYGEEFILQRDRLAGGDFVLHKRASTMFARRIRSILAGQKPAANDSSTEPGCFNHLVVTDGEPDDKLLWLTSEQAVVPEKIATVHLGELNVMNDRDNPYLFCDLEELFEPSYLHAAP